MRKYRLIDLSRTKVMSSSAKSTSSKGDKHFAQAGFKPGVTLFLAKGKRRHREKFVATAFFRSCLIINLCRETGGCNVLVSTFAFESLKSSLTRPQRALFLEWSCQNIQVLPMFHLISSLERSYANPPDWNRIWNGAKCVGGRNLYSVLFIVAWYWTDVLAIGDGGTSKRTMWVKVRLSNIESSTWIATSSVVFTFVAHWNVTFSGAL